MNPSQDKNSTENNYVPDYSNIPQTYNAYQSDYAKIGSNKYRLILASVIGVAILVMLGLLAIWYKNNKPKSNENKLSSSQQQNQADASSDDKKPETPLPQSTGAKSYASDVPAVNLDLTEADKARVKLLDYEIRFSVLAMTTVLGRVPTNAEEVSNYYKRYNVPDPNFVDPETKNKLTYVNHAPKRDQIQYVANRYCDANFRGLGKKASVSHSVVAAVILLDYDSYYCSSNLKQPK